MPGTTKQSLFTNALMELGDYNVDTGEDVESARALVAIYDKVVEDCLNKGSWNFAMSSSQFNADTGVEPNFGYTEVFAKPSDWIRTHALSLDEYFNTPLAEYVDENGYWYSDSTPIYVRYVSNDTGQGLDLGKWPRSFTRYVELELAARVCYRLTQDKSLREEIKKMRDDAKKMALSHDAMNDAQPKFRPIGKWGKARSGWNSFDDRGRRNTLTG